MASIKPLRQAGSLQNLYMFNMYFTIPSIVGISKDQETFLTFLGLSTTIPKYTREVEVVRTNNQEIVQPGGKTTEHLWTCKLRMTSGGTEYDALQSWYYAVDKYDVLDIGGLIQIELLRNFAGDEAERVAKRFRLVGAWPTVVPEIGELNQDEKTGLADLEYEFAFDNLQPGIGDTTKFFKLGGY